MAVGRVIVGLSRSPHGSYSFSFSLSDTLGNSFLYHALSSMPRRPTGERESKERGGKKERETRIDSPFFRSSGYVKASESARALKIAEEFAPSARKSKVTLKSASGSVPREAATFAASLARGMHYFAAWKCPRTGNRCRIA